MTETELITALHRENVKQEHIDYMLSLVGEHPALRVKALLALLMAVQGVKHEPLPRIKMVEVENGDGTVSWRRSEQ